MRNLCLVLVLIYGTLELVAKEQPNIVFILVDDLGYMDIGANNPKTFYETPNIDALAKRGVRFTNGYAANPVCSPTRYSIMTGKYPTRVDATNFFSGRRRGRYMPAILHDRMDEQEITIAERFREGGYQTAFFGKWHLGPSREFWPENQGFDRNVGGFSRGSPPGGYFSPFNNPKLKQVETGVHLPTHLTDAVVSTIEEFKDAPFFIFLSFYSVHTPLQAPPDLVQKYREKAARLGLNQVMEFAREEQHLPTDNKRLVRIVQKHAVYASMVESMDRSVGRVVAALDEAGVTDNTIICFTSDNGGLATSEGLPTSNLPLRGGKGWMYEGGIREPFLMTWPGHIESDWTDDTPVMSIDFYPTLLEAAGLRAAKKGEVDGVSLLPLVVNKKSLPSRDLFWHYPHYGNQGGFPSAAIRRGSFKLIQSLEDGKVQLYDLQVDISEQNDLASEQPQLAAELTSELGAWYREVDAKFLRPLPDGPEPWRPSVK